MAKRFISKTIQDDLKTIYDAVQREDVEVRNRQIRQWKELKLIWEGFSSIWFSEVAHDWRIWDESNNIDGDGNQAYYDKRVNIFKAYLESIIAALSVTVPPIKCYPDDADNPLDIDTAKAGDKIAQLVYRHNSVPIIWLHALFINVTEGMTAYRTYVETDKSYGSYSVGDTEDFPSRTTTTKCSLCGFDISQVEDEATLLNDELLENNPLDKELWEEEKYKFQPGNEDVAAHDLMEEDICPSCMQIMIPEVITEDFIVTKLVATHQFPKSRVKLSAHGGLQVKIPNYARSQAEIPYLVYSTEINYVIACAKYSHLHGNKNLLDSLHNINPGGMTGYTEYEQWGRTSPQYRGEYPINVITENMCWLRPAAYYYLADEKSVDRMKKQFPDGCLVTFVNDEFADAKNASLDDEWTIGEQPLADFLHFEPLGRSLVSVQEITNDLISLILQTIEHGISQTFADPSVLDFDAYEQTEVTPGGIFPAKPKAGKSLNDAFFELRTATLSAEVMPFQQYIQSMAQLTSGALPSLFGGELKNTETASGASMQRNQAMQRLQNTWKLQTNAWKTVFSKIVPMYIREVKHDERDVQRDKTGNFINTFIKRAEMEGRIGRVELEANENLPLNWAQRKDVLMELMKNANPMIQGLLMAPENLPLIHDALGLTDWVIPGENDVIKQYDEIKTLLNSAPIPLPEQIDELGMPIPGGFQSSVEVDPIMDKHQIEFDVVRNWAVSPEGRQAKLENPEGYQNVLLHGKEHFDIMNQQAMELQMAQNGPPDKKANADLETPIKDDGDVKTVN